MASADDLSLFYPNTVYQKVKDWAAEQEAFEKHNKAPAPLNNVQKAFLDSFHEPLPSVPLIDGKDYVSELFKYRQIVTSGNQITFVDRIHPVRNEQGAPQWSCTVELSEALADEYGITSFPATGFGLDAAGCYPAFAKKKDAKQFAAKCAIDFLERNNLWPSSLGIIVGRERHLPTMQSQPTKRPSEGTEGAPPPSSKLRVNGDIGAIDGDDDVSLRATERVQALCHRLNLQAPRYDLTLADSSLDNVFSGYADFGEDERSFPEDVGRVTAVVGRENARQEIAEKVLMHLREIRRQRAADLAKLLARAGP